MRQSNISGNSMLAIVIAYIFTALVWVAMMVVMVGVQTAVVALILKLFGVV